MLSDRIVVQITTKPGESFVDRMIALVEGAERHKTPNEIAFLDDFAFLARALASGEPLPAAAVAAGDPNRAMVQLHTVQRCAA